MKIVKKILIIILIIIVIIILLILLSFINHRIKLNQENDLFYNNKYRGKIVEVNNHNMNVYISGNTNSEKTLVFMSGWGVLSPTLDFKTLFLLYKNDYQIAVVERAGYGFSDITNDDRNIDTILDETRETLKKAGIKNNKYILFPHSISGIEALYWANKYPDEVEAIVGLDSCVPKGYENQNIVEQNAITKIEQFAVNIGLTRFIIPIIEKDMINPYGNLNEDEKELYRVIIYRRAITEDMINEGKMIQKNAKKLEDIDNTQVPMLFFISNGDETGFKKNEWQSFGINYINSKKNEKYITLDCAHNVHKIEYEKIYEESIKFINNLNI